MEQQPTTSDRQSTSQHDRPRLTPPGFKIPGTRSFLQENNGGRESSEFGIRSSEFGVWGSE
jgi:hypothetical protein